MHEETLGTPLFRRNDGRRHGFIKGWDKPFLGGRHDQPEQSIWPERPTETAEPAAAGPAGRPATAPTGPAGTARPEERPEEQRFGQSEQQIRPAGQRSAEQAALSAIQKKGPGNRALF